MKTDKIIIILVTAIMIATVVPMGMKANPTVEWTKNTVLKDGNYTVDNRLFYDNFVGADASTLDADNWTWNEPGSSNCNELNGDVSNRKLLIYYPHGDPLNTCYARTSSSFTDSIAVVNFTLDITQTDYVGVDLDIVHGGTVYARLDYTTWGTYFRYELRTMNSGTLTEVDHSATTYPPPGGNPAKTGLYVKLTVKLSSIKFEIRKVSDNSAVWAPGNWYDFDAMEDWQLQFAAYNSGGSANPARDTVYQVDNVSITSSYGKGFVRSAPIALPNNRVWDKVYFNSTTQANTYVNISVLDKNNNTLSGLNNKTSSPIDISAIPYTTDKIKLLAMLDGNKTLTSPVLKDWNVTWKPDIPVQKSALPDIHIAEDSKNTTFDLTTHFNDTYTTPALLLYSVKSMTSTKNITVSLANGVLKVSTNKTDWNGEATTITIGISDGEFTIVSNSFKVIVDAVNDPPTIEPYQDVKNAEVGKEWNYTVVVHDVDGPTMTTGCDVKPQGFSCNGFPLLRYFADKSDAGHYVDVSFWVSDSIAPKVWLNFSVSVDILDGRNHAPVVLSTSPATNATVGKIWEYQILAMDPDGDNMTFELLKNPKGMAMTTGGEVMYYPVEEDNETLVKNITVLISDDNITGKLSVYHNFSVWVNKIDPSTFNYPPVITSLPINTTTVGEIYRYPVVATDRNGDALTYRLDGCPTGMSISTLGTIFWTPDKVGNYNIQVIVSDGPNNALQTFILHVFAEPNHAPIITSVPPTKGKVNETYTYTIVAYDPDGDNLTYSLDGPPKMILSNPPIAMSNAVITWKPLVSGTYPIILYVSDYQYSVHQYWNVTVDDTAPPINHAPVISNTDTKFVTNETTWNYTINASDQDKNTLTYSVQGPSGMFISSTGRITWMNATVGNYTVTVTVSDGKLSANYVFQLEVEKKVVVVIPPHKHGHGTTILDNPFPILAVVAVGAGVGGVGAYAYSRRKKEEEAVPVEGIVVPFPESEPLKEAPAIDDIFLVYRDGRLISHRTRQLKPDMDDEVLGGMFTAVQDFVKTSFGGEEGSSVDEISYGGKRIMIEHGKYVFVAVVIVGEATQTIRENMKNALYNIEFDFGKVLDNWNGSTKELNGTKEYIQMLIAGVKVDKLSAPVVLEEQKKVTISGKTYTEGDLLSKLSSMPRGMPMVFIGKDPSDLASEFVVANYVDNADGDVVFQYENKWYHGNPADLDTWLQKAKGPEDKRLKAPSIDGELDELGRK